MGGVRVPPARHPGPEERDEPIGRTAPYMLIITLCLVAALAVATRSEAKDNVKAQTARTIVATWRCQDKLPVPRTKAYSPWKPHTKAFRHWQLQLWTKRLASCRAILNERARQWNWQAWLPDHWRRVAQCETQLNWQHSNSSYQGAFGFAISSWDAFKNKGYPDEAWQATPWEQYQTALNIYNRYGMSGWGCKG